MDALAALGSGLLAGIGLAAPLGAIGVLLLQEGVARGFRSGAPGAVAVAVVDTLYCSAAILLGALAAPVITGWGAWPRIVGGVALILIAAIGCRRSLGWGTSSRSQEPTRSLPSPSMPSDRQRFALFLGLTAINPATLVYFTAITVGLASLVSSAATATLFVVGVGGASLSWQLALVAAGALVSGRMTPRTRRATSLVGNVVVAGLGVGMLGCTTRRPVCFDDPMTHELVHPPKAHPGDRVAILSPSYAAPGDFPQIHEQAMQRLAAVTGLVPVEFPTTRLVGASPQARAADLNAAFADPGIRGILATIGGEDEITVIPHLDATIARRDPKPFLGYSDNTNLHHWLWANGIASFYGGSSQVHLGPGPAVDEIHASSMIAALTAGGVLEITEPGFSQDIGIGWDDPRALTENGDQEATTPWTWSGPPTAVTGRSWGGCVEAIGWILTAGRFPFGPEVLEGSVLLLETSEELLPARQVGWIVRSLGERGILAAVDAVLLARPPVSDFTRCPSPQERARLRDEQRDVVVELITRYNRDAVVCVGVPFGHTRPQWILPHGGLITVDGAARRVLADYS